MAAPGEEELNPAKLDATYQDESIHSGWKAAYRSGHIQTAFEDAVYNWLFEKIRPTRRWLDAGCGTGQHSVRLARHGCEVACMDISAAALEEARAGAPAELAGRLHFLQGALEDFDGASLPMEVENVHCRGVLMHVPDWRAAVRNLARQVKHGGYFVIFEGNCASLEWLMVRSLRGLRARKSNIRHADAGPEFWAEKNGNPFLVRMFDLNALTAELKGLGFTLKIRRSLFLLDVFRVPSMLRTPVRLLNRVWFSLNGPCPSGVILVFQKEARG